MVRLLRYTSGATIQRGDLVRYHGQPGEVEFIVSERTGDSAAGWYLDEYTSGGCMISAEGFGRVFLTEDDIDEYLEFIKPQGS
jgi:hypothetical protein